MLLRDSDVLHSVGPWPSTARPIRCTSTSGKRGLSWSFFHSRNPTTTLPSHPTRHGRSRLHQAVLRSFCYRPCVTTRRNKELPQTVLPGGPAVKRRAAKAGLNRSGRRAQREKLLQSFKNSDLSAETLDAGPQTISSHSIQAGDRCKISRPAAVPKSASVSILALLHSPNSPQDSVRLPFRSSPIIVKAIDPSGCLYRRIVRSARQLLGMLVATHSPANSPSLFFLCRCSSSFLLGRFPFMSS